MSVADHVRGALGGLNDALGNSNVAAMDFGRETQDRQNRLQLVTAPLSQSLAADQQRLASLPMDSPEREPIISNMAMTLGKLRNAYGDPTPHNDPSALERMTNSIRRHVHLGGQTPDRLQAQQVASYNGDNRAMADEYANAALPYGQTAEAQKLRLEAQLREQQGASNWQNFKLPGGQTVSIDVRHQQPPAGAVRVGTASSVVRSTGRVISPQDAIKTMDITGQPLQGPGGTVWTNEQLSAIPKGEILTALADGDRVFWVPVDQRTKTANIGGQVYQVPEAGEITPGTANSLGAQKTGSSSVSVDPAGLATTTTHTPQTPGMTGATQPGATQAPHAAAPEGPQTQKLRKMQQAAGSSTHAPLELEIDANGDGHIPASDPSNPLIKSAADQLINGMAIKDIQLPVKDKQAAEELAQKYGAGQGMFTPREKMQVQQSQQLIENIRNDKKLMSVFSENALKRGLIQSFVMQKSDGDIASNEQHAVAASMLNDNDTRFIQTMRNLIGRIQGLAQLTRGTGRPTEAAVNRMMQELPNLNIASNPAQAKQALDLIQNEIDIAMKHGIGGGGSKTLTSGKPKITTAADYFKSIGVQ